MEWVESPESVEAWSQVPIVSQLQWADIPGRLWLHDLSTGSVVDGGLAGFRVKFLTGYGASFF